MIAFTAGGLLGLLTLSIPVGIALFLLAFGIDQFFSFFPLMKGLGQVLWSSSNHSTLIAIPLFVLIGEILLRSGVASKTYMSLNKWVAWLPGGLIHANIATSTMFSATSGSSVATAATVARVATPHAEKLGYDQKLFTGSIAAGGTLGILIPPSINLIVYGFLTESSIPQLFLAGIVPGLGMAILFMLATIIMCSVKPSLGGPRQFYSLKEKIEALSDLIPIMVLLVSIVGSIYAGWATPTEAAAVGAVFAMIIATVNRSFSTEMLLDSLKGTIRITSMIMLVVLGAYVLNFAMTAAGIGRVLQSAIESVGLNPITTLLIIIAMYVLLGFFIETLSLMVVTIPIVVPIIVQLGYDKIWFGILMIVLVEMALITPPVGLNLYVVNSSRVKGKMQDVILGSLPYVMIMILMVVLLILFPSIALYLPTNF